MVYPQSPLGHPGTTQARPWDPQGRPWDPLGTRGEPHGPQNLPYVSQQIYSGRSPRLLHTNPPVATHRPNDSSGPSCPVYVENGTLFGRAQGRTRGDPRFQEGVGAHGRTESAHSASRPGYPLYMRFIYIYIYINMYIYTHYICEGSPGAVPRA